MCDLKEHHFFSFHGAHMTPSLPALEKFLDFEGNDSLDLSMSLKLYHGWSQGTLESHLLCLLKMVVFIHLSSHTKFYFTMSFVPPR